MPISTRASSIELRPLSRASLFVYFAGAIAILSWPFSVQNPLAPMAYVCVIACMSLASMSGIWCAIARRWWRFLIALVVSIFNGFILATSSSGGDIELWVVLIPLLISIPIVLTLEIIKIFLGRFTNSEIIEVEFKEGLQFGISHLMITTAIVAVLCAIGRALAPLLKEFTEVRVYSLVAIISAVLAFNTLVSTWALLGKRPIPRLIISLLLAVIVIAVALSFLRPQLSGVWAFIFSVVWLVTTIQLALLRSDGVRFVRVKR